MFLGLLEMASTTLSSPCSCCQDEILLKLVEELKRVLSHISELLAKHDVNTGCVVISKTIQESNML